MRVRHMDWNDDLVRLQGRMEPDGEKKAPRDAEGEIVPEVDVSETFDVILGSDILYEVRWQYKRALPSVSPVSKMIQLLLDCMGPGS